MHLRILDFKLLNFVYILVAKQMGNLQKSSLPTKEVHLFPFCKGKDPRYHMALGVF